MTKIIQKFSNKVAWFTGSKWGILFALVVSMAWFVLDRSIDFLDVVSLLTFDFFFILQYTTNRNDAAIQAKLDELIRVMTDASDDLIEAELEDDIKINELREQIREQSTKQSPPKSR